MAEASKDFGVPVLKKRLFKDDTAKHTLRTTAGGKGHQKGQLTQLFRCCLEI